jgi:hypothetical protein
MPVNVFPDKDHPMPDSFREETGQSFHENVNIAANTAVLLSGLGMPYEMSEEDVMQAKELFETVEKRRNVSTPPKELRNSNVALALAGYIGEYGKSVVATAAETRTLIHNRLIEISQCGDVKHELKAIELLGKMSDVGAFTEKSELVITHKSSDELQAAIREKISRLLHSDIIDVEPLSDDLEKELGLLEDQDTEDANTEPGQDRADSASKHTSEPT